MENYVVISSIITAIATVCYTVLTFCMILQMKKNNELLEEPLIYVYIQDENWNDYYLKLENIGRGVAYNISFKFEPDFKYELQDISISEMPLFKHTKQLKPGEGNKTFLDCNEYCNKNIIPDSFIVKVE